MNKDDKLSWLKTILLIKVGACLFLWGLPMLLGPSALYNILGLTMPKDLGYLRTFGAVVTALGFLYWFAYKDPYKNVDIIKYAIIDNGLAALTLWVLIFKGYGNWMFALSAVFALFVFIAFIILFPGKRAEIKDTLAVS